MGSGLARSSEIMRWEGVAVNDQMPESFFILAGDGRKDEIQFSLPFTVEQDEKVIVWFIEL